MSKAQDDDLVMSLVELALARAPAERRSYVESACAGDSQLFASVWDYVRSEQRMSGFLLQPLYPPLNADHPFHPGDVLEMRFRIVSEVAQGGMGIVYEAIDERLERRIALKCAKPGFRKRLPPEVRNASDISHPNVCKIFEIHTAATDQGEVDFLTMEFIDGETLAERLRSGPVPEAEARAIALQLCAGLAEAHRRQVIHGDLKSSNIILSPEPEGGERAVITDFGLARKPDTGTCTAPASQVGGTPDYMAPELWKGARPSTASDIYALGVILGELARGTSLALKWERIVGRCRDAEPSRRYANAVEIAQLLTPRTRRWFVGAAAAAVLAIVSGLATYEAATGPQQRVRLTALPFAATADTAAVANALYADVNLQIAHLQGNRRTAVTVISPDAATAKMLDTPSKARALLGVTHVLRASIRKENARFIVQARFTDARSQVDAMQWTAVYPAGELRYAPVALAGMITGTLQLPAPEELASVKAAARLDYETGLWHLRRNSGVDLALAPLERAAASDPDSALTHAALAERHWLKYSLTNDGDFLERARDALSAAERRNPDAAAVHRVAGLIKAKAGLYEQAEADYLRAIELEPGNADAYRRLGMSYDAHSEHDKALAAYLRAVEIDPGDYRNHQGLGNYYKKRANYRDALPHFQRAVELAPQEPAGHVALAAIHYRLGSFAEAEKQLRVALDLNETWAALNNLADLLLSEGRDQEALVYLSRALSHHRETYLLWMNAGIAYRRLHLDADADRANRRGLELAEIEVKINPRHGYVRACVGYFCARLGERQRAESEVAQALQLTPHDIDTRRMAVKTYEALGRRDDALVVLRASAPEVVAEVTRNPDLAELRTDPRFVQILTSNQTQ